MTQSQSSQILSTQDIGDISDWEGDCEMEPCGWASLVPTSSVSDKFYCVDDCEYILGRDSKCDFRIPLNYISSRHCSIFKDKGIIFIKDLSSNGTYLARGKTTSKIGRGKRAILKNGDKVILIQRNIKVPVGEC